MVWTFVYAFNNHDYRSSDFEPFVAQTTEEAAVFHIRARPNLQRNQHYNRITC